MEETKATTRPEQIAEVGKYEVMICEPRWEQMPEKDGDDNRMALVLPCHTEPDAEHPAGQCADFYLYFTRTLFQSGRNKGRPTYEVNMEQCLELGMSEPFTPDKIHELNAVKARLEMKEDTYDGKTKVKPAFLNPIRYQQLTPADATNIWNQLTGGKPIARPKPVAKQTGVTASPIDPNDDLPF